MPCVQLLMELQKVAFKAEDSDGPILQSLTTFTNELHTVTDRQIKVKSLMTQCMTELDVF